MWNGPFSMTKSFPKTIFVQLRKGQVEKTLFHIVAPTLSPSWLMVTDGMCSLRKPWMYMFCYKWGRYIILHCIEYKSDLTCDKIIIIGDHKIFMLDDRDLSQGQRDPGRHHVHPPNAVVGEDPPVHVDGPLGHDGVVPRAVVLEWPHVPQDGWTLQNVRNNFVSVLSWQSFLKVLHIKFHIIINLDNVPGVATKSEKKMLFISVWMININRYGLVGLYKWVEWREVGIRKTNEVNLNLPQEFSSEYSVLFIPTEKLFLFHFQFWKEMSSLKSKSKV